MNEKSERCDDDEDDDVDDDDGDDGHDNGRGAMKSSTSQRFRNISQKSAKNDGEGSRIVPG